MTGMVTPTHVCSGFVSLQPQSTVLIGHSPGRPKGIPQIVVGGRCVTVEPDAIALSAMQSAGRGWGDDRVAALLTKAASAPATTTQAGWAA
jgi:hypothetical protein